jgi:hypothetical protein
MTAEHSRSGEEKQKRLEKPGSAQIARRRAAR